MSCEAIDDSDESDDEIIPIKPEDWERYKKQVQESEGFDVDHFPGLGQRPQLIAPVHCHAKYAIDMLSSAIDEHNQGRKDEGRAPIALERIVKLNSRLDPPSLFYTFEANDADGTKRTYQAQINGGRDKDPVKVFREKSSPDV